MQKINSFDDVRVLSNKDIYRKVGKRMPQMPKDGGVAVFGLSKVTSIAEGERLVISSLNDEMRDNRKAEQEALEKAKAEASKVAQQEAPAEQ